MPYVEHGMWEVLDVLQRAHRGEARRQIERATRRSRKTIGRYIDKAAELGWKPGGEAPTEALAAQITAWLRPGPRDLAPDSVPLLEPHAAQIREWLSAHGGYERGLKLSKVHELLRRQNVEVSYWALRRFAQRHFDYGKDKATVRVADVKPGELAEVDFGRLGLIFDPESGRKRALHALIVTLAFSRHQYVHVTHSQNLYDLIDGLEGAWKFFGGIPARVVIDNMRTAVTRADRYEPTFQRTFNEYAGHRGFVIDAAIVRHPQGKPHVERQVQYVRDNFFRGETWINRDHVQREANRWCLSTAGQRVHGTTRQQPLRQFEAFERGALRPLAPEKFDTPQWGDATVHRDHHIQFDCALYSVPYQHEHVLTHGKKVTVRGDRRLVRIYLRGQLIKTHPRKAKGERSTDVNDYPPEKTPYAMRDANCVIGRASEHGASIGGLARVLLAGDFPWANLRQAQRLVRLVDKYGAKRVNDACARALCFDLISVKRVERIITQALDTQREASAPCSNPKNDNVIPLPLKFLRPSNSLIHTPKLEKENGNPTLP